ncbi:MAG: FkbM family methyltransferase [Ignavibacteriae bacterium]|nr:FkbM family methyltransferase [Ignavibacteriota bacterium]
MNQLFYKIIYNSNINFILRSINKFLLSIIDVKIKIPPSGTIFLEVDSKKLKIKTNQTNFVTHLLYWKGYLNFEYTNIFLSLINKIDSFYDVGANIGYYSLLAAIKNPNLKVVSFEPARGPLFYLQKNVDLNNLKNIQIQPIALSDHEGEIIFYESKNSKYKYLEYNLGGEGNAGSKTDEKNFIKTKVPTITFNKYIVKNKVDKIDLIKIDTEGTENLILENADLVLDKFKPIIICETLFNVIEEELENLMKKFGYEFYNHEEKGLKKVATIKREFDNKVRNCFFVHPIKYSLIEEYLL